MKVGFIGLGRMGQGMAGRIIEAGHDLLVSDPTPGQTQSFTCHSIFRAKTLGHVFQDIPIDLARTWFQIFYPQHQADDFLAPPEGNRNQVTGQRDFFLL